MSKAVQGYGLVTFLKRNAFVPMSLLNHIFKVVSRWIVPWAVYEWAGRTRRIRRKLSGITSEEARILAVNEEFKDKHLSQRCFILCTGPSIKKQDLKLLKEEICISVSNFFVHPDYQIIQPRYHCIAPYHSPISEQAWQYWLDELAAKTGNSTIFVGVADRQRNEQNNRFENKILRYLKFGLDQDDIVETGIDLTQAMMTPQSVSIVALQVAIYMGFKKIYLLGCDHNWVLHHGASCHFYDESQHALNRKGISEWQNVDMFTAFTSYADLWKQYKAVRKLAEVGAIEILNATNGGLLDVFPRVQYESVVKEA